MIVVITEITSGKVVAQHEIHLGGMNYAPTEEEYIKAAWEAAVSDRTVDNFRKIDYSFSLAS